MYLETKNVMYKMPKGIIQQNLIGSILIDSNYLIFMYDYFHFNKYM